MIEIIAPRAGGKTTAIMQWLREQGGGTLIVCTVRMANVRREQLTYKERLNKTTKVVSYRQALNGRLEGTTGPIAIDNVDLIGWTNIIKLGWCFGDRIKAITYTDNQSLPLWVEP